MSQKENPRNPAGRNGVPTKLKELRGTARPGQTSSDEPDPEMITGEIEIPDGVLPDAEEHFQHFLNIAIDMGVMTVADVPAMVLLANSQYRFEKYRDVVDNNPIITQPSEQEVINPVHKIANDELATVKQLMIKFGMTPSDRRNVKISSAAKKDKPAPTLAPVADFSSIGKYSKS